MTARSVESGRAVPIPRTDERGALVLVLPWPCLVTDNDRHGVIVVGGRGRIVLTKRYREALTAARMLVQSQMRHRPPLAGRLALTVTIHEPDRDRVRDLTNLAKLTADALEPGALANDGQLDDVRFIRGAVDAESPRAVLTLTPVAP